MTDITLYTHPLSRGTYVVWMLKECGADYTVVPIQFGAQIKSADYLAVNPQGQVPALKFGDTLLTETAAILTFLAEQFPEKNLIPAAGTAERGEYYRWLCLSLHLEYAGFNKMHNLPVDTPECRRQIGYGDYDTAWNTLRAHLQNRDYIVGNRFTALDLYYAALILHFTRNRNILPADENDVLQRYAAKHLARPAFAETMAWAQEAAAQMPSEDPLGG